ncbi:MAG: isoprenylcysteine carboxylmethyltransferase family protein [Thaumarchaeota archaeon]|nr:isoprenylcysteine carboxylmethyltransferase family protein [Nitrososphaerota archaeon]MCL5318486.1 isoprenylcysteine carboxylmethyltransferase family protein [Nitrososphaerota archaeon]
MRSVVIGRLLFASITSIITVLAGGGPAFLLKPIGAGYMVLWITYWLVKAGRRRGEASSYDKKQRVVYLSGAIVIPMLVIAVPWEYANFTGPIPRDSAASWVGLTLFALGIVVLAAAMRTLGKLYTSYLGIQPGHRLVTTGPYRHVRHPGYLGEVLVMFGIGFSLSSVLGLALAFLSLLLVLERIKPEEEMLTAEFGDEYRKYMGRTKRLIPFIY